MLFVYHILSSCLLVGSRVLVAMLALVIFASACATGPSPLAPTVPASPAETPVIETATVSDRVGKAVIADWEEMFITTQSYEYAAKNAQVGDKAWWTEQIPHFYSGKSLADQQQNIEFMFSPRSLGRALAFLENARYTAQLQNCTSDTDCTLQIHLQSGQYWAYDTHYKRWTKANTAEPVDWTVPMQYDPAAGHWKIK
jgi:hypothetical protein